MGRVKCFTCQSHALKEKKEMELALAEKALELGDDLF